MLRRLFKSGARLSDPDPGVRRAAVEALDADAAAAAAQELARLVRNDPDPGVRRVCIPRVTDPLVLESLLDDPVLGTAAAERLLALNPARDPSATAAQEHPRLARRRLLDLPVDQAAARLAAIADIDTLVELALAARGDLREQILGQPLLHEAGGLASLERGSRHKDKSLNRHARRLLDERRELLHQAEAARQRAEELASALERHGPDLADRAARERQHELHRRLDEVLDRHGQLRAGLRAFGDDLADLEALRGDPASLPPLADPVPQADHGTGDAAAPETPGAGPTGDDDPFDGLEAEFRELDGAMREGGDFGALAARRQALTERWLTAADHQPPNAAQHEVFEAVSHHFRELADAMQRLTDTAMPELPGQPLSVTAGGTHQQRQQTWQIVERHRDLLQRLQRLQRQVNWPRWAGPAAEYVALGRAIDTLTEEIAAADQVLASELDHLDTEIEALNTAIDEGHLNQAQGLLNQTRSHLDALPNAATRRIGRRVGKQAARLAELKDWQTFATSPKREQLVGAMEALAATPLAAPQQAERIKELRREWQALGPITQASDGRLADRFNERAEAAFEPCRAHFAELAAQRQQNLAERQRICDQLESYLADTDWSDADMKAAERIMRAARDEWRRYHPVDRQPGRAMETRFESLQSQLHDRVKGEWDRNLQAKEAIVAEAKELEAADLPMPEKIAMAKTLQRRWREVGITPRRPDQQLWRAFRAACDHIFEDRDHAREAAQRANEETEARMRSELDRFDSALSAAAPGETAEAAARELRKLTADIETLPPGARRTLEDRRGELLARHRVLLAEGRRLAAAQRLALIRQWDETADGANPGAIPEQATGLLDHELVSSRQALAGAGVPLEDLRRLTVRAELAAGRESPASDESLRLALQVERLQAGLGGGAAANPDSTGLLVAWCRLGPKDAAREPAVEVLRERFFTAIAALPVSDG